MTISLVTPPLNTRLTSEATALNALGLSWGDVSSRALGQLIDEASARVETVLKRRLPRAVVSETFFGSQDTIYFVDRSPIADLESVTYDGTSLADEMTDGDIRIVSKDEGTIYRTSRWTKDVGTRPLWAIQYRGGYLLPDDDVSGAVTISVADASSASGNKSYYDSASGFPLLSPGDWFRVSGMTNSANNGVRQVVLATTGEIEVSDSLTNEVAGASTEMHFRSLPYDIEWATLSLIRSFYQQAGRDPEVVREELDGIVTVWASGANTNAMSSVEKALSRYIHRPQPFTAVSLERA